MAAPQPLDPLLDGDDFDSCEGLLLLDPLAPLELALDWELLPDIEPLADGLAEELWLAEPLTLCDRLSDALEEGLPLCDRERDSDWLSDGLSERLPGDDDRLLLELLS